MRLPRLFALFIAEIWGAYKETAHLLIRFADSSARPLQKDLLNCTLIERGTPYASLLGMKAMADILQDYSSCKAVFINPSRSAQMTRLGQILFFHSPVPYSFFPSLVPFPGSVFSAFRWRNHLTGVREGSLSRSISQSNKSKGSSSSTNSAT